MSTKVNLPELMKALELIASVNQLPPHDIVWIKADGTEVEISKQAIDDWYFTGLSNASFADMILADKQ